MPEVHETPDWLDEYMDREELSLEEIYQAQGLVSEGSLRKGFWQELWADEDFQAQFQVEAPEPEMPEEVLAETEFAPWEMSMWAAFWEMTETSFLGRLWSAILGLFS